MSRCFTRRIRHRLLFPLLEQIEPRQLLSAADLYTGGLRIIGTSGDDRIVIAPGKIRGDLTIVTAPGYEDGTVLHGFTNFYVDAGDGNDYIEVLPQGLTMREWVDSSLNTTLRGGAGDDTIISGDESADLDGGPGDDNISAHAADFEWKASLAFGGALHGVNVRLDLGEVLDDGFGGHDLVSGVGGVKGTIFNDTIYTGERSFTMYGNGGDDFMLTTDDSGRVQLVGGSGNDTLEAIGEHARSLFAPGRGNDTILGGGGGDAISLEPSEYDDGARYEMTSGPIIRLDRGLIENDGYGGVDVISSIESVSVFGDKLGTTMVGTDANETLVGGEGPDLIIGGGGDDYLVGGGTLMGGDGNDQINSDRRVNTIDGGPGSDTINTWGCKYDHDDIVKDKNDAINVHIYTGSMDCLDGPIADETAKVKKHKHHKKPRKHKSSPTAGIMMRRE